MSLQVVSLERAMDGLHDAIAQDWPLQRVDAALAFLSIQLANPMEVRVHDAVHRLFTDATEVIYSPSFPASSPQDRLRALSSQFRDAQWEVHRIRMLWSVREGAVDSDSGDCPPIWDERYFCGCDDG